MKADIIQYYTGRLNDCDTAIRKYNRRINTYSLFRLLTIVLGFLIIYQALNVRSIFLTFAAFFTTLIVFAWLVRKHSLLYSRREYFKNLKRVNENEIGNIRNGENIYSDGSAFSDGRHPYSSDLDIFGPGSLFQLVNRTATSLGSQKLSSWLGKPADRKTIEQRQEAVRELSARKGWTQDVQTRLLNHKEADVELTGLFNYLKLSPLFSRKRALKNYVAAAPYIFLICIALTIYDRSFQYLLVLTGVFNGALIFFNMAKINQTDRLIGRAGLVLKGFGDVFAQIENEVWKSRLCIRLQSQIGVGSKENLSQRIARLSSLTDKLDYRLNILVSIVLNYVFVWDLRQVFALENWKEDNKQNLETAFDVVAEIEALISIASIYSNNPEWCFPVITEPENHSFIARGLGHPLVREDFRITNDFTLDDARIIELITGSNMAGKSTFLRTVGINAVLAFSGAPVCAKALEISIMQLVTYMRITDSLNESTSTFKAELDRLQMILKVSESGEKAYFLIDEMLRGTNSVDKYRGSRAVIKKLLGARAAGMVATHDLQLAKLREEHPEGVRNFHFDIQIEDGEMRFDYKLKQGECRTFNASLLLKKIGVDV
jgi:hypothetical protein